MSNRFRVNQEDIKFITPEFHERIRKSALAPETWSSSALASRALARDA